MLQPNPLSTSLFVVAQRLYHLHKRPECVERSVDIVLFGSFMSLGRAVLRNDLLGRRYTLFARFVRLLEASRRPASPPGAFLVAFVCLPGINLIRERKVALTDSESGKYSCTSGARTTAPFLGLTSFTTVEPSSRWIVIVSPACVA